MKAAAIILLVGGCFSKPDPPAAVIDTACVPSQPSAAGLTVESDADPVVTFPNNATLGFANDASGYPMPVSLRLNGQELVASPEGCALEDQVGIAVYPLYSISGNDIPTSNSAHVLDREVVGPAVTQLRTNWQWRYGPCPTNQMVGTGHTQWSLFPNGRVVRNDYVVPSMAEPVTPSCNCPLAANATQFTVTSYFAFETAALQSVTATTDTNEPASPPVSGTTVATSPTGCVRGTAAGRVAFRWDVFGAQPPAPFPTRLRTANNPGTGHVVTAFVYDMSRNETAIPANTSFGVRTHMLLETSTTTNCINLGGAVTAYAASNPLTVAGEMIPYSAQGIYNDVAITSRAHTLPVIVTASSGSIRGGFVIAVQFADASAVVTSPAVGVVWQREANGVFYVYFPDALAGGSSLTITPEC